MGYDRNPRGDYGQRGDQWRRDQARWDRDDGYSSHGMGRDDHRDYNGGEYGNQRYGQREQMGRGADDGRGYGAGGRDDYGDGRGTGQDDSTWRDRDDDSRGYGRGGYGRGGYGHDTFGQGSGYGRGSHDRDGSRYGQGDWNRSAGAREGYGDRHPNDRGYSQQRGHGADRSSASRGYGAQPQGYSYEDRGFLERAGDEVRSWFGDEDAERRRDQDARMDERYQNDRDSDYGNWRRGQIDALDRDYHEYRQENRSKFESEFSAWRSNRQTQRASLDSVKEHMEVVGSDGSHVGTVDKVRGDRIVLTKNDADAGGHHHSIPSSWLGKIDDKVTLSKTADEAKRAWRDEENRSMTGGQATGGGWFGGATGGTGSDARSGGSSSIGDGGRTDLNKSFSGTY